MNNQRLTTIRKCRTLSQMKKKKLLSKTEHKIQRNFVFKIYILKLRKNDKFSIIRIKLMINLLKT